MSILRKGSKKKRAALLSLWAGLGFYSSCKIDPDSEEAPGSCPLNCDSPALASVETQFKLLTASTDLLCTNNEASLSDTAPITFRFQAIASKTIYTNGTEDRSETKSIPLARIAFEPDLRTGLFADSPVLTPDTEWCTDSCGVATLTIQPKCPAKGSSVANKVSVGVSSGALVSDSVVLTLTNQDSATTTTALDK